MDDPLSPPPDELYPWTNRFDDPSRGYKTVYAAEDGVTALLEVLADLKPDTRALAEFADLFGRTSMHALAGTVTWAWRIRNVLVPARALHDAGFAGVAFGSNETDRRCYALFDDRARYVPAGDPIPLSEDREVLLEAVRLAGLRLEGPGP